MFLLNHKRTKCTSPPYYLIDKIEIDIYYLVIKLHLSRYLSDGGSWERKGWEGKARQGKAIASHLQGLNVHFFVLKVCYYLLLIL